MANQLQITGDTKVKSLNGVLTGTSGVVGSVPLGAANGVATLDSGGKVPVSQLPSSVVTYLGTWNAATNTPTLTNGVGDAGDMYICNVAGTVNFGAGPVTFAVGDWVLYGSGTWQKSNGQNGTVTSVGASITGGAIGITGSPITTAGTLAFAFAGTSGQYVNGAGNLTTFPTLITSIGLSMPSAFSVANSPLTANGSINVTGAGTTLQFIDGTGALQTFPTLTGYVPYTGATQDVDLGAFKLNAQSLHIKGTAGNGHLGLKHQSASATASANEVSLFADSLGDLSWLNGNLYLSKFITSGNTAARSYTFPNSTCNIPNDSLVVHLAGTETISGVKTFSANPSINVAGQASLSILSSTGNSALIFGYVNNVLKGTIDINATEFKFASTINSTYKFQASGLGIASLIFNNTTNYSYTFPAATGTLALTSDISYPVTSVFGRTGAVVATEGDYSLTQLSDVTITTPTTGQVLKYNGTTWINDTDANTGTVTSVAMTVPTGLSVSGSPITSSGTLAVTLTAGYSIPTTASQTTWDTAYTNRITSLTTTGSSGVATLSANTLNIPNYGAALSGYLPLSAGSSQLLTGDLYFNGGSDRYIITNETNTGTHTLAIQAGGGSGAYGGSIKMFANAHSTNAGDVIISTSAVAGAKIRFTAAGLGTGTEFASIDRNGVASFLSRVNVNGAVDNAAYALNVSGTGNFTGALSGTSAYFTSAPPSNGGILETFNSSATTSNTTFGGIAFTSNPGTDYAIGKKNINNAGTFEIQKIAAPNVTLFKIDNAGAGTFTSSITATSIIKSGGTSSQFLKADGSVDSTAYGTGTVTSVAALTLGTTGTDLSSSVANSTTTPIITLNVPTASATNRGALSSADWTTFNNKQSALTNPVLASGTWTSGYLPKINGTYTIGNSIISESGSVITIAGNLNIGSLGSLSINAGTAATPLLTQTTNYTEIYRRSGGVGIYLGGTGDAANYYDNTVHYFRSSGGGSTRMTIDASGNLGLGVTPSAWSGVKAMQIGSDASGLSLFGYSGTGAEIGSNVYFNGTNYAYGTTAPATRYVLSSGQHRWYIAPSGTQDAAITFTQAMTLTAAGNLGLGVNGSKLFWVRTSDGAVDIVYLKKDETISTNGTANLHGYDGIIFRTTGSETEKMRIWGTTGNVNIGTTPASDAGYKLDVNGTGRFSGTTEIRVNTNDYGNNLLLANSYPNNGIATSISFSHNTQAADPDVMARISGYVDDRTSGNRKGSLRFYTASGGTLTQQLTIASTGAATFSSSVTAPNFYASGGYVTIEQNNWVTSGESTNISMVTSGTEVARIFTTAENTGGYAGIGFKTLRGGGDGLATRLYISSTGAATFSSSVTAKGDLFIWGGNAAQAGQITANSAGGGLYIGASGTNQNIRLVPSGTGIVQSLGSFDVQGAATFSSSVTAGGSITAGTTAGGTLYAGTVAAYQGVFNYDASSYTSLNISNSYDNASATINFKLRTAGTSVTAMTLLGSGAATFSSRLMVNGATDDASNALQVNGSIVATSTIAAVVSSNVDMFVFNNTGATYTKSCVVASMTATGGTGSYFFYGQQSTSTVALKIFSNGNIQNTNNSYGAISDARLKENIIDATPKLADLMKVKIRNYNLKGESNKQLGVISQELEEIFPNMIEESTNLGENVKIKGVKYSVFVPMLIKAVQEQQEQINELKQLLNK